MAVLEAERDDKGYVKVRHPSGQRGKLFLPDTNTANGLHQTAEAIIDPDHEMKAMPVQVRYAFRWMMESLDAEWSSRTPLKVKPL